MQEESKDNHQKTKKEWDFFFFIWATSLPGRPPANFQLDGSASASLVLLSSGAAALWLLVVSASVFNDVCAGGRRPARRTATLSVCKLVWVSTSSGRSGHMARSSRRRRLACFARSLASCSGGVRGVARGNGNGVFFILLFSFFLLGGAF